ncbi:MAG: CofH family radical SAM protein [Verrucomicrobia bacterium]|nr:CofH family radical SAM protein [Verrucomicrobiota bacterium]
MNFVLHRSDLRDLYEKVVAGERLSEADALRLFESKDLNALGAIADFANRRQNGNRASFIVNRYINYSNYCILSCQFCAFARKKRDADGFELTVEQIVQKAREALAVGVTELHIVGGLHPSLPFSYYVEMLKALSALNSSGGVRPSPGAATSAKPIAPEGSNAALASTVTAPEDERTPKLQLKCFTAIEILHLAWLARKDFREVLAELKAAGLDSLTGGGAEIFRSEVRSAIAKGKESAEEWLDVHRAWHQMGGRSTCTMLYGHVESLADRVDHLRQLRALQDESCLARRSDAKAGGFTGFVPLPYQPENNQVPVQNPPTGFDALRTIAVSRIYLDNFDHITAYWVGMGLKLAQVALSCGADDLHGTIIEEHIFHMAGAKSPQLQTEAEMIKAIRETGRVPVQRDTFYEPIKILENAPVPATTGTSARSKVLESNLATA